MTAIRLSGHLVCSSDGEAGIVRLHLPEHMRRTRAEPGCISFTVIRTADPLVWAVDELFEDQRAFELHQTRVAGSEWGRMTAGIERRYSIEGLSG